MQARSTYHFGPWPVGVRSRALLILAAFVGCALGVTLLACSPTPPPSYISLISFRSQLAPGTSANFIVQVLRNGVPAAATTVQVRQAFYPQGYTNDANQNQPQSPLATAKPEVLTTDAQGFAYFQVEMPQQARPEAQLMLSLEALQEKAIFATQGLQVNVASAVTLDLLPTNGQLLYPGVQSDLLVRAYDHQRQRPLPQVAVVATVGRQQLQVTTDSAGLAHIPVEAPMDNQPGYLEVAVSADTPYGRVKNQTTLNTYYATPANVLISTDKPVYQPGQTIHLRALALNRVTQAALATTLTLTIRDPRSNQLVVQTIQTSDYGIATLDWTLDSQAATGDYYISVQDATGYVQSERTVEVKPYTLPRFAIHWSGDRPYYQPGDQATGEVTATYFFGKPVANGQVILTGLAPRTPGEGEKTEIFRLEGVTDEQGRYRYAIDLPTNWRDQLTFANGEIDVEVTVIDSAQHSERTEETITLAERPYHMEAVAESGYLRPGLGNLVYLQVERPDGSPAAVTLTVDLFGQTHTVTTDQLGLATLTVTPTATAGDVVLTAQITDQLAGAAVDYQIALPLQSGAPGWLLLRPAQAEITAGDPLQLEAWVYAPYASAATAQVVQITVQRDNQVYATTLLPVTEGRAQGAILLDPQVVGTVELVASLVEAGYQSSVDLAPSIMDTRLVLVNPAPVQIDVRNTDATYRPGDTAVLDIEARDNGAPFQGMLGISIVDESVFALGAQDPGFARTYFLLAKEMSEPRYGIDGFAPFGEEASPYQYHGRYSNPSSTYWLRSAAQARQTALFGALAQDLLAAQSAQAATTVTGSAEQAPVDGIWIVVLVGLAVYAGQRQRWPKVGLLLVLLAGVQLWAACAPAAPAPAGGAAPAAPAAEQAASGAVSAGKPRLRQYFPETLLWLPELATDADGRAQIAIPIADSITTWRMSIIASDKAGRLGSAQIPLRVMQDFFIEPDLPSYLSQGDELDVPVSIFNYLDQAQEIRLTVAAADWFELRAPEAFVTTVAANEVTAVTIPIRVTGVGQGEFTLTATGSQMSDAVVRPVEVRYNAEKQRVSYGGRVADGFVYDLPTLAEAVPGSASVTVRFYPGLLSQALQGLESMLQEPYGCFEQTSSTTYPNVMILNYLQSSGQVQPAIAQRASHFIGLGYQRLLTFEVPNYPGGFSLWGEAPAQTMLTAYGLMEFTDMRQVSYVDPALIDRIAAFLWQQQQADGSWTAEGMTIESGLENLGDERVAPTAYVAWALADAGYGQTPEVQRALAYLRSHLQPASDPYIAVMALNALVAADPQAPDVATLAADLITRTVADQNDQRQLPSAIHTYMGGYGEVATIDATAMLAIALLRANHRLDVAQQALHYLLTQRSASGGFVSTQSTVLVLKALVLAEQAATQAGNAQISVSLNNGRSQTVTIASQTDEPVVLTFDNVSGATNQLQFTQQGERLVPYQVVTEYYVPWTLTAAVTARRSALQLTVQYEQSRVAVNETVAVTAAVTPLDPQVAGTVMVVVGVPPGFTPVTTDLAALVTAGTVDFYELRADQVVFYLSDLQAEQTRTLPYRLLARIPGVVQAPASQAYAYYTPAARRVVVPQQMVVTQ